MQQKGYDFLLKEFNKLAKGFFNKETIVSFTKSGKANGATPKRKAFSMPTKFESHENPKR
jgi:hypothetical protein